MDITENEEPKTKHIDDYINALKTSLPEYLNQQYNYYYNKNMKFDFNNFIKTIKKNVIKPKNEYKDNTYFLGKIEEIKTVLKNKFNELNEKLKGGSTRRRLKKPKRKQTKISRCSSKKKRMIHHIIK